jgi:hypothetical protein
VGDGWLLLGLTRLAETGITQLGYLQLHRAKFSDQHIALAAGIPCLHYCYDGQYQNTHDQCQDAQNDDGFHVLDMWLGVRGDQRLNGGTDSRIGAISPLGWQSIGRQFFSFNLATACRGGGIWRMDD